MIAKQGRQCVLQISPSKMKLIRNVHLVHSDIARENISNEIVNSYISGAKKSHTVKLFLNLLKLACTVFYRDANHSVFDCLISSPDHRGDDAFHLQLCGSDWQRHRLLHLLQAQ
ncbi:hypothetical protein PoB_004269600 [Plakobranchus ocellatus]|uniref:Uncharacterized protein n=1 Tax=Plakobranchus ocellatus TaxID=259542 RepID=A0AAV4B6V6_9GAST|nr:hypothetical protein PoB_004269600 [Plakobranchus ocellatus]